MKKFIVICALIGLGSSKVLNFIEPLLCKSSDPEYEKCVQNGFKNATSYLLKGIPELSVPPMDPFLIPMMVVNRTHNNAVRINAISRNIRIEGARNIIVERLKADPKKNIGEIRLTLPWAYIEMEYDVTGQLLTIPLQSKGYFKGNFSDIKFRVKTSFETYEKDADEYFRIRKISSKIVVSDGWIKLTAKNPDLQFAADIISNFFNENPQRVLEAVNPIFVETFNELFKVVADQILANMKASEWLPA
ncbi:uncharacterized protein [Euwallacea similis]|uniref:uncharacterized protein n=1 Tax=Euwallacea similis TaxID=1736056 RepID=UPI003450227F